MSRRIVSIQLLRALACLLVLFVHLSSFNSITDKTLSGSIGVDIFFIISGFIISASVDNLPAERPVHTFFVNRLSRVAPYYYLLTLIYAIGAYISWRDVPTVHDSIASILFISQGHDPIHPVGWTLNHELFFYLFVGLSILFTRNLKIIFTVFLIFIFLVRLLPYTSGFLKEISASINLEFIFGMIIYQWRDKIIPYFHNYMWIISSLILLFVVMSFTVETPFTEQMKSLTPAESYYRDTVYFTKYPFTLSRGIIYGIPSALVFLTILAQEARLKHFSDNNVFLRIGNASFTLYLIQHLFIIIIIRFVVHSLWALSVYTILMIALSLVMYRMENYVARHTKKFLLRVI